LTALETYVSGLADLIIDYASARLDDEPFSTSPTEGAVQCCTADGSAPANALVATWCSSDAPGSNRHRQRNA
jgi:hypothetical protein